MNLFFLDRDPELAAQAQCDKHVCKMIIETAQMMSTAHMLGSMFNVSGLYLPTHENHPSTVWVRSSPSAYRWTWHHLKALCEEYTHRYDRIHATQRKLLHRLFAQPITEGSEWRDPPQCMPDEFKQDDTVEAYRAFYRGSKVSFARWTKRPTPRWMTIAANQQAA